MYTADVAVGTTSATFTLGELLDQDFGLRLLVGGEEARRRRIAGAHVIEIEHPSVWLEPDWIMLTAGVRLRHSAKAQRELVAELQAAGAAALGFGVELVFKRVPPALRDEAERRDFPIFEVPLRTPFRDIVTAVHGSVLSSEVRSLRRLSSLQLYLMDALSEPDPRTAVLGRLSSFLGASVTLFSPRGEVIEATGAAPTAEIWARITAHPPALVQFEHEGWQTIATPVSLGPAAQGWLAVSADGSSSATRLTRAAVRVTTPVLTALGRLEGIAEGRARALRAALLDELIGCDGVDSTRLTAQASSLGIDFASAPRLLYAAPGHANGNGGPPERELEAVRDSLERALASRGCPHLSCRHERGVAVLAQLELAELRPAAAEALAEHPGWTAGVGRGVTRAPEVRDSLRDAEIGARRAAVAGEGQVLAFDDFDLATLLVSETESLRVRPKIDELLRALQQNPAILEAVRSYFEHDLDIMRTAEAMHLHHNSLRYRLGRAEEFLGRSLKDPATIASLYLALTASAVA